MIEINISNSVELQNLPDKITKLLNSRKFFSFLEKKCKAEISKITNQNISGITDNDIGKYAASNKTEIGSDYLDLYNDSMVDISNLSEKTRMNYPEGLSLAKLVEYGTGVVGRGSAGNNFAKEDNWKYDLNKHDTKGWYYEDNGSIYWTKGMEGKLIYHKFRDVAEEKMRDWVEEFLISNLK